MSRRIESLVADIADDVSVDWQQNRSSSRSGELVREFRIIAAIGASRDVEPEPSPWPRFVEGVLAVATGVATAKLIVALVAIATTVPLQVGPRALMALAFGVSGGALVAGGRRDVRARALGAFFILIGSTFTRGYLLRAGGGPVELPAQWLLGLASEGFLAFALWVFAWVFPSPPRTAGSRRLCIWGLTWSLVVALVLVAGGVVTATPTLFQFYPSIQSALLAFGRGGATGFWPVLLTTGAAAFPYLLWKSLSGSVEDRTRVGFLALALVVCLSPIMVAVLGSSLFPGMLARRRVMDLLGLGLYLSMLLLVLATVYVVVVRRVLDVHLIIRRALQHSLARQVVWAVSIGSPLYAVASMYAGRDRTVTALFSERAEIFVISAVGFAALTFRPQLLRGVDCWFRRDGVDYSDAIARLVDGLDGKCSIRDLQMTLSEEVLLTLRSTHASVLVLSDGMTSFVSLDGRTPALPAAATLVGLVGATRREIHLASAEAHDTIRMLPALEREWIMASDTEWLFPLIGSSGSLVGLLCLGESRSRLPYSERDRAFASAVTSQVALRMENLSLRRWVSESGTRGSLADSVRLMDWQNEPAMQCPGCLSVGAPTAKTCSCGTAMVPGSVPTVLNGKFRVERVLGSGGMGIVYAATDAELHRRVAIKTMPQVTPKHVGRMQREARAMAAVRHPNLAMIYGVERWRDVPLLVVEFLDGGTLAESLRASPLSVEEVLDLGIVLADVLDKMHSSSLLHRDIKPSNIGYSGDGVVKLLDFGLAAMLAPDEAEAHQRMEPKTLAALLEVASPTTTLTLSQQILGTPLYLSPEGLAGDAPDQSFDLWSLALVLYESLAGRHPLAGYPVVEAMRRVRSVRLPDVRDFRADCPPALAALLNDALALSRERRPQTAAEFRVLLQGIRHGLPSAALRVARRALY